MMAEQTSGYMLSAALVYPAARGLAKAASVRDLLQVEGGHPHQVIPNDQGSVVERARALLSANVSRSVTGPSGPVRFASGSTGEISNRLVGTRRPATVRNRTHERIYRTQGKSNGIQRS